MERIPEERRRIRLHTHLSSAAIFGDVATARYWLARGAEVNHPTHPWFQSPLFQARSAGDMEMVALFREAGAHIGPADAAILGETEILRGHLDRGYDMERLLPCWNLPLIAAAAHGGSLETVQLLVDRGANVIYTPRTARREPLAIAATNGHREIASSLARMLHSTGFLEAVMLGDTEKVTGFLDAGADPSSQIDDLTPLTAAALTGQVETARLLLDRGADLYAAPDRVMPDGSARRGMTALDYAARYGWTQVVLLLVDYGLPVDDPDKTHGTPLAHAMFFPEMVRALLARGADPNTRDASGSTALHRVGMRRPVESTRLLLEAEAAVDPVNDRGWTPLMQAVWGGAADHARLLLAHGADPRRVTPDGKTCLNLIDGWTWRRGYEIQSMLLELGLDINTQDHEGQTPLMRAARTNYEDLAQLYLDHGADRTLCNAKGETAIDLARNSPHSLALLTA